MTDEQLTDRIARLWRALMRCLTQTRAERADYRRRIEASRRRDQYRKEQLDRMQREND